MSGSLCKWHRLVETQTVAVGQGEDVQDGLPAVDTAGGVGPVDLAFPHGKVEHLHG